MVIVILLHLLLFLISRKDTAKNLGDLDWQKIRDTLEVDEDDKGMKNLIKNLNEKNRWKEICDTFAAADDLVWVLFFCYTLYIWLLLKGSSVIICMASVF